MGAGLWLSGQDAGNSPPPATPAPVSPTPCPPSPRPSPSPSPWGGPGKAPVGAQAKAGAQVGGRIAPNGATQIHCDLPGQFHIKNVGGSDGAGLCVFTSCEHSGWWQNIRQLHGFQDWMKRKPGGGWPEKVDKMLKEYCQEQGLPVPPYIQVEGKDLEILKLACRTGRMPAVTYSRSPTGRYGGGRIAHMVSLPHADDQWFAVLDNNYIGEDQYEWMSPREFEEANLGSAVWSVIFLGPPPPPVPRNK